jgi:hypothetical protein
MMPHELLYCWLIGTKLRVHVILVCNYALGRFIQRCSIFKSKVRMCIK